MNLEPKKQRQDVVFRRVRGRIIPIRKNMTKKQKNETIKGAALVGAGAAVAAGGGEAAAQLVKAAAARRVRAKFEFNRARSFLKSTGRAAQGAFDFMGKGSAGKAPGATAEAIKEAVKTRRSAFRLFKARNIALAVGANLGAALIAAGAHKLISNAMDRKPSETEEIAGTTVAGIAGGVAAGFYYRRLGLRGVGRFRDFIKAKTTRTSRPFNIPITFKKGGPFGKGGTFRFRG